MLSHSALCEAFCCGRLAPMPVSLCRYSALRSSSRFSTERFFLFFFFLRQDVACYWFSSAPDAFRARRTRTRMSLSRFRVTFFFKLQFTIEVALPQCRNTSISWKCNSLKRTKCTVHVAYSCLIALCILIYQCNIRYFIFSLTITASL